MTTSERDGQKAPRRGGAHRTALDHVLTLIVSSPWHEALMLRGSMPLHAWVGAAARESGDLDWVVLSPAASVESLCEDVIGLVREHPQAGEGLILDANGAVIDEDWAYETYQDAEGLRLLIPWRAGTAEGLVQLDFTYEEKLPEQPVTTLVPVGDGTSSLAVRTASRELSLAWKIRWIWDGGRGEIKGKDIYDAVLLAEDDRTRLTPDLVYGVVESYGGEFVFSEFCEMDPEAIDWDVFCAKYPWVKGTDEEWWKRLLRALSRTLGPVLPVGSGDTPATAVSVDGHRLRTAGDDGTLGTWGHLTILDESPSPPRHVSCSAALTLSAGRQVVATGDDHGAVRLCDLGTGEPHGVPLQAHERGILSLTGIPMPEGRTLLAAGDESGRIVLWDPEADAPVRDLVGAGRTSGALTMVPVPLADGRRMLATGSRYGLVRLLDPTTGELAEPLNRLGAPIRSMAVVSLPDGRHVLATVDGSDEVPVRLWDTANAPSTRVPVVAPSRYGLSTAGHSTLEAVAAVSIDGHTLLATADDKGMVGLWDPTSGTLIGTPLAPEAVTVDDLSSKPSSKLSGALTSIAVMVSPAGRTRLAVSSGLGRGLRVWEPSTGQVWAVPLDVTVTSLAAVGSRLVVAHRTGLLTVALAE